MGNQITLDYLPAEQGVLANTSCCVYINNSGKVKTDLEKNHAKAGWWASVKPQSHSHSFFNLSSWLNPDTWGSWLSAYSKKVCLLQKALLVALATCCLKWPGSVRLCGA